MRTAHRRLLPVLASVLAACATTSTYSPALVRVQDDLARVEADERIAEHAPRELAAARRALEALARTGRRLDDEAFAHRARTGRRLDDEAFAHRLYVADRLVAIAAAEGLARAARERAELLSTERETLLIDARTRQAQRARADDEARIAVEEAQEQDAGDEPE
jgi:hypothetical protein